MKTIEILDLIIEEQRMKMTDRQAKKFFTDLLWAIRSSEVGNMAYQDMVTSSNNPPPKTKKNK